MTLINSEPSIQTVFRYFYFFKIAFACEFLLHWKTYTRVFVVEPCTWYFYIKN